MIIQQQLLNLATADKGVGVIGAGVIIFFLVSRRTGTRTFLREEFRFSPMAKFMRPESIMS